jgi:hypothetical protein
MKRGRTEKWAKWRRLVSEQIASGQTVAAFCRDRGLRDFDFTLSRGRDGPKYFLKDYGQVLLADAHGGYDGVVAGNAPRPVAATMWTLNFTSPNSLSTYHYCG